MSRLLNQYVPEGTNILDVGATHGIANYSPAVKNNRCNYNCLDMQQGADYVPSQTYNWGSEVPDGWQCIISGQTLEHDKFFWITLKQISDRLAKDGIFILILPSKGEEHRFPVDCYRFYQDCAEVFAEIMGCDVLTKEWHHDTYWGDLAMVFKKR
jgi:hypothetical protein